MLSLCRSPNACILSQGWLMRVLGTASWPPSKGRGHLPVSPSFQGGQRDLTPLEFPLFLCDLSLQLGNL